MKWLAERPRPVPAAWNILCDAVNERLEYFGMSDQYFFDHIAPVPAVRTALPVDKMQQALKSMADNTFAPQMFGQWYDTGRLISLSDPAADVFSRWGIDGSAFLMSNPAAGPHWKHSISDFIRAAGKLLDKVLLYPLPRFNQLAYSNAPAQGVVIESFIHVEGFVSGSSASGTFRGNYGLLLDEDSGVTVNSLIPVKLISHLGRGRSDGQRWVYDGAGEYIRTRRYSRYRLPILRGKAEIRSDNTLTISRDGETTVINQGMENFVMDFDSGKAEKEFDLSVIAETVADIWENRGNYYRASVDLTTGTPEILLKKDNFPELPYKYVSDVE